MAIGQRISALHKRHEWLDQVLLRELAHPHPDEARVTQIKKSKLRVKDEIASLECVQHKIIYASELEMDYQRTASAH